jgi:hypothetical protein
MNPTHPKEKWYYSPAWQDAEREADDDLRAGRYEDFRSIEQVIAVLRESPLSPDNNGTDRLAASLRRTSRRRKTP